MSKNEPWEFGTKAKKTEVVAIIKCKCGQPGQPDHTCPYAEEINGDSTSLCNCCDDCQHECCMDI